MYSRIVLANKEVTMSQTVNVRTYHVVVDAPAEAVFDFVQDVTNLPLWAVHFCTDVRVVDDGAMVQSPSGELYFGTTGDRDLGVVDWWCGPTMLTAERWPTRVVGLPDGRSLYQVTAIFGDVVPPNIDALFAEELEALRRLVEERAVYAWDHGRALSVER
jgi:hypothetical protein